MILITKKKMTQNVKRKKKKLTLLGTDIFFKRKSYDCYGKTLKNDVFVKLFLCVFMSYNIGSQ